MVAEAEFRHGEPTFANYTPGANVAGGEVVPLVLTGLSAGVAHLPITSGILGAIAVGGGVYNMKVAGTYAAFTKVWWDDTAGSLTTTSTNNYLFGFTLETSAANNSYVKVMHRPEN